MTAFVRSPLRLLEALTTPHGVDRYLELIHPMLTVREVRAEVTAVTRPSADSVSLTLRPTRQWQGFRAGQFVQVEVDIDGVRTRRCYSPSSSQHRADGRFELTVKAHPGGLVSRHLYDRARPGLVLGLSPADGAFCLPHPRPERLLLVSGGSGITPVLSMLRTLCDEGHAGQVTFLHYARTATDVPHLAQLRSLAGSHDNVRLVLVHTGDAGGELDGHFGPAHLAAAAPWYADAETFVCGPPGLVRAVREHYEAAGLIEQLHVEQFVQAPVPTASDGGGTVHFLRSGRTTADSGGTLLDQAEAAGLRPDFGCRMGICHTCTRRRASGATRDLRTGETTSDPDTEIQLCISVPVGDVAIDI